MTIQGHRYKTKPHFWALVLVFCLCTTIFSAIQIISIQRNYQASAKEYDALRAYSPPQGTQGRQAAAVPPKETATDGFAALAARNPDFIGWLRIAGTGIDYPVVQGEDNDKYLKMTFEGERNRLGAIFMDYRCKDGFDAPYAILYGHNAKDGSMFGGLHHYLDSGYLAEHPTLSILMPDGSERRYTIFAAHKTDTSDGVYSLDTNYTKQLAALAGVQENGAQFLTLSTCTSGQRADERLILHALRSNK